MPKRIQQKRTAGWKMPPNARSVARPSKYGNPFTVKPHDGGWIVDDVSEVAERHDRPNHFAAKDDAVAWAVELYELHTGPMGAYELEVEEVVRDLAGRDLACWCPLPAQGERDVCHASILLEVANGDADA